jgi:hypothetical protein
MATVTWVGNAASLPQKYTVTFALTWASGDTVTTTVNGKAHVVTMGTAVTDSDTAAAAFRKAYNGTSPSTNEFTVNFDASLHGDFNEFTASIDDTSDSLVNLICDTPGKEATVTSVAETTAGDGTATLASAQTATGKNHFDNADNWDTDTVPVDDDDIVCDRGNVSILYALDTGVDPDSFTRKPGYTGRIGLPPINTDNPTQPYDEYRDQYLKFTANVGLARIIDIDGGSLTKIDLNDLDDPTVLIRSTGSPANSNAPAVLIKGDDIATNYEIRGGVVGLGWYESEDFQFSELFVSGGTVECGPNTKASGNTDLRLTGGMVTYKPTIATASNSAVVDGGTFVIENGAFTTITVKSGTILNKSSDLFATVNIHDGGSINCDGSQQAQTWTTTNIYGAGELIDTQRRVTHTNDIDCNGTTAANIDKGKHFTVAYSDI